MILSFTVFGERGLLRIYEMKREMRTIKQKSVQLEQENKRLSLSIEGLRSDRGQLERIARKELGLVRRNEVIYQFPATDRK